MKDTPLEAQLAWHQANRNMLAGAFASVMGGSRPGGAKPGGRHLREPDADDAEVEIAVAAEFAKVGVLHGNDDGRAISSWSKSDWLEARNNARRAINAISARALNEKRELSRQEGLALDGLSDIVKRCDDYIGMHDEDLGATTASSVGAVWRTADGKPVYVLANTERVADLPDTDSRAGRDFGFGEYVRAMVTGSTNPDIRAALSEGTDSAGGYTVPVHLLRELIDRMRSKTVCIKAGARTVPLDTMTTKIARLASDPAAAWRNENAAVAESDPTFEAVVFQARSLAVLVKVSREVLEDSVNINDALMNAFAGAMAGELDRVALFGTGVAPQPLGVFNTTNVGSVSMGTNGAQLTNWDKVIDLVYEMESDNSESPTGMVMHPRTRQTIAKLKDTTNQPLAIPPVLTSIPQLVTTSVPITQVQGTSGSVCSTIVMGDFKQLMFGVRQELRVDIARDRFIENLQYAFVAHLRADIAVAHPESFAKLIGILP
jgi:HK97 family phage major capsid protein